ncbi:preprotein translocase subunit YajC [Arcanobacterium canis]
MPRGFELIIILVVMVALMWFMSRGARKAQAKAAEEREKALVVGTNVVTNSGFFGRIVDIDGDAVTLESPSGDETVWMKRAILQQMDLPLGYASDDVVEEIETSMLAAPSDNSEDTTAQSDSDK